MSLVIDIDRDPSGSWTACVRELGDLVARDETRDGALRAVQVLALRRLAEQLQRGERAPFAAFGVSAVEGPTILSLRAQALAALRELQADAQESGASALDDADIDAEIRAARDASNARPSPLPLNDAKRAKDPSCR